MKKAFTLLILCCVLFLSFKKNEMKSVNLSKDCKMSDRACFFISTLYGFTFCAKAEYVRQVKASRIKIFLK